MAFAGFGLAAAVGISGCGSSSDGAAGATGSGEAPAGTPKEKVAAAFKSLNDSSSAGFTIAADTTAADIKKIGMAQGEKAPTAAELKEIEQLIAGKVTMNMTAPEGKTFGQMNTESTQTGDVLKDAAAFEKALKDSGSFAMSVVHEESGLFELSSKDGVFYVRADAEKIAKLADQNLNSVTSMLGQLPPVVATPAEKLFAGEWVSLDMVKAAQLMEKNGLFKELSKQEATVGGTTDPAKVYALMDSLEASYEADSEVTEVEGGYRVSVPAKKTAAAIEDDLIALMGESEAADIRKDLAKVPDKNFVFDVLVDGDKLSGINVDIVQFMKKPVEDAKFSMNLGIDPEASEVQVPTGATAIDVEGIFNMIPADSFSSLGSGI